MSWYCVMVAPRQEARVQAALRESGLKAMCPREKRVRHTTRGGRREVTAPIFPGYLFVRLGHEPRFDKVRAVAGVWGFVHRDGHPAALDVARLAEIRREERGGRFDYTKPRQERRFALGQRVKIRNAKGSDADLIGKVVRGGSAQRLNVLWSLFGGIEQTIEVGRLEAA